MRFIFCELYRLNHANIYYLDAKACCATLLQPEILVLLLALLTERFSLKFSQMINHMRAVSELSTICDCFGYDRPTCKQECDETHE